MIDSEAIITKTSKLGRMKALGFGCALTMVETLVLTILALVIYGLVISFITAGDLSVLSNLPFAVELLTTYGAGIAIAMGTDKMLLARGRESIARNPLITCVFGTVIIASITSLQIAFPEVFSFFEYIQVGMGAGTSVAVAISVDFVASLMTVMGVVAVYRLLFLGFAQRLLAPKETEIV